MVLLDLTSLFLFLQEVIPGSWDEVVVFLSFGWINSLPPNKNAFIWWVIGISAALCKKYLYPWAGMLRSKQPARLQDTWQKAIASHAGGVLVSHRWDCTPVLRWKALLEGWCSKRVECRVEVLNWWTGRLEAYVPKADRSWLIALASFPTLIAWLKPVSKGWSLEVGEKFRDCSP